MRILYHHRTLGDGAEGIHIDEMVNAFRELGHDVRMVGPAVSKPSRPSTREGQLWRIKGLLRGPVYEFLELAYNLYGYRLLQRTLAEFRPVLIYDRYSLFNYSCVAAGREHGIPVFLEVNAPLAYERDHEPDESLYLKRLAYATERGICSRADKTFVVSSPLQAYLKSAGVPEEKLVLLPNGVNPRKFHPRPKSNAFVQKLRLTDSTIVIGFVGILRPWHGLDMLLRAFRIVHDRFPESVLFLVGDGPIRHDIEKAADRLGIIPHVRITGRVPHAEVNEYISLFDVSICPKTTFYASPMKILEYMAQGKAVVAPDTANVRDLIDHDRNGILFHADSPSALSNSITSMIEDKSLRDRLGKAGLESVRSQFNWAANAMRVMNELENLVGKK